MTWAQWKWERDCLEAEQEKGVVGIYHLLLDSTIPVLAVEITAPDGTAPDGETVALFFHNGPRDDLDTLAGAELPPLQHGRYTIQFSPEWEPRWAA